jgi:hypothetical protein
LCNTLDTLGQEIRFKDSQARPSTGCTTKATIDQITDTTSNITGTTSGAAW